MLDPQQWQEWVRKLQLSESAANRIQQIRVSAPARRVQSRRGNVSGRYPSRKMGVTIQFESHRQELAAVYELEHDVAVLEYYDQPPAIKLNWVTAAGRGVGVFHTPDFFVLRVDSAGYEECKPVEELERLAEKSPQRYQRDEQGRWRCPPGEQAASQNGLYYRLRSSTGIDWIWQRNMQFLEDYLRDSRSSAQPVALTALRTLVTEQWGLCLSDLFQQTEQIATRDEIYAWIATGELYVDLSRAPLRQPEQVRVYAHREAAQAAGYLNETAPATPSRPVAPVTLTVGQSLVWDGVPWQILQVGETLIALRNAQHALQEVPCPQLEELVKLGRITGGGDTDLAEMPLLMAQRLASASVADFRLANQRAVFVRAHLRGEPLPAEASLSARTLRDWTARYRAAEAQCGSGYIGLLPQIARRGNRLAKIPERSRQMLTQVIAEEYETLKQPSRLAVYAKLLKTGETQGVAVPSYRTFCLAVAQREVVQQTRARQGRRAAYQRESFFYELTLTTPRHGDRPFEICHLDHTQADLELVCSETGMNLGRPWVTFLSDAFSRSLLALWLTYDPPSYRSCMMALRECVRRHGRLPQTLVVDGGREFESVYFETLLARYECTRKTRPGAQPRFGSVCERLFGTAGTQFFHNLIGNTQLMREVRQVTKGVEPKAQAVWTLGSMAERLQVWAYDLYAKASHPALGRSPREAFAQGLLQTGARPQRLIPYDEEFLMLTRPTTRKGMALVLAGRGVRIHHLLYWCEAFRNPQVERTQVAVRYDPYDIGSAWAYVNQHWYECHSEYYALMRGRSEKELRLACAELHARQRQHARRFTATAKQLGVFLQSAEAEELLLKQRRADREARHLIAAVEGKAFAPSHTGLVAQEPVNFERDAVSADPIGLDVREEYEEF